MRKYLFIILSFVFQYFALSAGNNTCYYWFDEETERRLLTNFGSGNILVDVSHLSDGLHSFNVMLKNNDFVSVPVTRAFIKMPAPTINDSTTLKFWIDGAEYTQQKVAYGNEVVDFELDVDSLSTGMHFLQVQAVTNSGSASNIASGYFMRMPCKNSDGVIAYRYWVNDNNTDLAFTAVENPIVPYEFIGDLDVEPQALRCANFHFEVNDDKPMLYAVNDLTVQFFSVGGHLINANKEFIEGVASDTLTAEEWIVVRRDTVIKANTPKDETIYWYTMNLEEGDTVGVKTNYSSTLQVYSHSGKKVFESKTDSSLVMRQFIAEKDETYYLALHTVNTTKSQVTLTIDINEFVRYYNVNVTATAGGSVTGGKLYLEGTDATITATPAEGYHFVKWSDGETNVTRTIKVTTDVTLTAEFAINVYTVTLSAENGTVTGAGEYQHGATANINAVAAAGYHFVRWSDGNTEATRSIVVTAAVTLTAEFAINVYTVTLNAENGTVKGAGSYNYGTDVTLTATPAEGYHFVKWSDGDTNATRTIIVTADVTLTAEFVINVYTVTLNAENGTVTGAGEYEHGATANITAVAAVGYHFVKWSDGELNATRTIKVTSDVTLTAEFAINVYTVEATAVNGTVTGAGEYNHGTEVTLTATPAEGYRFVKWSDGDTNATRTITVTADVTLIAEFAINVYTVTLNADDEMGRVVGAGSYSYGETVTIVALANEHYHFVKWSDGDENDVRVITITDNITLTAEFAPNMYELVLNCNSEEGRVIGAGSYEYGKEVTIVAMPNSGYHFVKWSDGDKNDVRTILIENNITLTAEFASNVSVDVEEIKASNIVAYSQHQTLYVEGVEGMYYVLDMTGNIVYYGQSSVVPLPCGVYMIVANGERHKVMIR